MESQIVIRSLNFSDIPLMHKAFLSAFSDYTLDFNLTEEKFIKKFVEKLNIDFDLSAGAFVGDELVGFIFTNVGEYQGSTTAYNGGSGVIPGYRGRKLTVSMYHFLLDKFRRNQIDQCVLEVLTNNKAAIKSYNLVGFKQIRFFKCFKLEIGNINTDKVNQEVKILVKIAANWPLYQSFADIETSYLDQYHMLQRNMLNEMLVEAHLNDECVGYAIYQRDIGRISQIGVNKSFRRKGIGSALINYLIKNSDTKYLTVLNIDENYKGIIRFLKKSGFANKVNQYEMVLKL